MNKCFNYSALIWHIFDHRNHIFITCSHNCWSKNNSKILRLHLKKRNFTYFTQYFRYYKEQQASASKISNAINSHYQRKNSRTMIIYNIETSIVPEKLGFSTVPVPYSFLIHTLFFSEWSAIWRRCIIKNRRVWLW